MTPSSRSRLGPRDAGRAGGLAAEPAGTHPGLGVHDLLVAHLADDAVAEVERPQALLQVHRAD